MSGHASLIPKYRAELSATGTILLTPDTLFSSDELSMLDSLQANIPEEKVQKGDADDDHNIFVKRIRVDHPGCNPTTVNGQASEQIIEILEQRERTCAVRKIFGVRSDFTIRRCQMHRMVPGSFVGVHLDAESDPDFEYSVIIQLGKDFDGGEFVVYPNERETQIFKPTYGTVLITTCKFRHEVKTVRTRERRSLVYFYSMHRGPNRRIVDSRVLNPAISSAG
jgi:hypothetical protein